MEKAEGGTVRRIAKKKVLRRFHRLEKNGIRNSEARTRTSVEGKEEEGIHMTTSVPGVSSEEKKNQFANSWNEWLTGVLPLFNPKRQKTIKIKKSRLLGKHGG